MGKSLTKWLPLYRIENVLTHSNYINRKVGTNFSQCVHRGRLRPIKPQYPVEDISVINLSNFTPDPSTRHVSEPSLFDKALPDLLTAKSFTPEDEVTVTPAVVFWYRPHRASTAPPLPPPRTHPHHLYHPSRAYKLRPCFRYYLSILSITCVNILIHPSLFLLILIQLLFP